ncbi:putative protein-serine/threonine phosphatase [Helianthus annuus]|nr:putative protein-serine/threonine phosphatase [Helianthus annuus]
MIASFTPCVNYITGSSANGGSPTASCCKAVESLMTTRMDCTCFIVTGNVPFSLPSPINQVLAITLPVCNSKNVPFQCKCNGFQEFLSFVLLFFIKFSLFLLDWFAATGVLLPPADYTPRWGFYSISGKLPEMEDYVAVIPRFMQLPLIMFVGDGVCSSFTHFFGVYDGHGGSEVRSYMFKTGLIMLE